MARTSITGVRWRDTFLEWTTLSPGKKGIEVLKRGQVKLQGDAATFTDPEKYAAAIRQQCPELVGPVVIGLSPAQMLMRVVELPTTDPAEMAAMIQLQVDQFSPLPEERMAVSYEILRATATSVGVLIAAVPKEQIEFLGVLFCRLGLAIARIDAEIMGWWHLLSEHGAIPSSGRHLLLLLEPSGGVWLAVHDGLPQAVKVISPQAGLTAEEYAEELASDLGALIVSLDLQSGPIPVTGLDCWSRDLDLSPIVARLQAELPPGSVRVKSLDVLPSLSEGLARRAPQLSVAHTAGRAPQFPPRRIRQVRSAESEAHTAGRALAPVVAAPGRALQRVARLDLVPAAWRARSASEHFRKRMLVASGTALVFWLVGVAGFFVAFQWSRLHLNKLEARLLKLQPPADEVRRLQRQVHSFETYLDRQYSALECLREISACQPTNVDLTVFQFKKGKTISLRGEALAVDPIYDFKKELDKSPLFKGIEMGSTQPSKRKDVTAQTFQMNVQLKEQKQ